MFMFHSILIFKTFVNVDSRVPHVGLRLDPRLADVRGDPRFFDMRGVDVNNDIICPTLGALSNPANILCFRPGLTKPCFCMALSNASVSASFNAPRSGAIPVCISSSLNSAGSGGACCVCNFWSIDIGLEVARCFLGEDNIDNILFFLWDESSSSSIM
jgi:hypothetical protein